MPPGGMFSALARLLYGTRRAGADDSRLPCPPVTVVAGHRDLVAHAVAGGAGRPRSAPVGTGRQPGAFRRHAARSPFIDPALLRHLRRLSALLVGVLLLLQGAFLAGGVTCPQAWGWAAAGAATAARDGGAHADHGSSARAYQTRTAGAHADGHAHDARTAHAAAASERATAPAEDDANPGDEHGLAHCVTPACALTAVLPRPPVLEAAVSIVAVARIAAYATMPASAAPAPETPPPRA